MTEKLSPNPPSPFATADPAFRHAIQAPSWPALPVAGVLAVMGCARMAVVPDELTVLDRQAPPQGLCPDCAMSAAGILLPEQESVDCEQCDAPTRHGDICAMCLQDGHDAWVADGRPMWEALYEPGNVSTVHLGWHHTPDAARAAASDWFAGHGPDGALLQWAEAAPTMPGWFETFYLDAAGQQCDANMVVRLIAGARPGAAA